MTGSYGDFDKKVVDYARSNQQVDIGEIERAAQNVREGLDYDVDMNDCIFEFGDEITQADFCEGLAYLTEHENTDDFRDNTADVIFEVLDANDDGVLTADELGDMNVSEDKSKIKFSQFSVWSNIKVHSDSVAEHMIDSTQEPEKDSDTDTEKKSTSSTDYGSFDRKVVDYAEANDQVDMEKIENAANEVRSNLTTYDVSMNNVVYEFEGDEIGPEEFSEGLAYLTEHENTADFRTNTADVIFEVLDANGDGVLTADELGDINESKDRSKIKFTQFSVWNGIKVHPESIQEHLTASNEAETGSETPESTSSDENSGSGVDRIANPDIAGYVENCIEGGEEMINYYMKYYPEVWPQIEEELRARGITIPGEEVEEPTEASVAAEAETPEVGEPTEASAAAEEATEVEESTEASVAAEATEVEEATEASAEAEAETPEVGEPTEASAAAEEATEVEESTEASVAAEEATEVEESTEASVAAEATEVEEPTEATKTSGVSDVVLNQMIEDINNDYTKYEMVINDPNLTAEQKQYLQDRVVTIGENQAEAFATKLYEARPTTFGKLDREAVEEILYSDDLTNKDKILIFTKYFEKYGDASFAEEIKNYPDLTQKYVQILMDDAKLCIDDAHDGKNHIIVDNYQINSMEILCREFYHATAGTTGTLYNFTNGVFSIEYNYVHPESGPIVNHEYDSVLAVMDMRFKEFSGQDELSLRECIDNEWIDIQEDYFKILNDLGVNGVYDQYRFGEYE